VPAWDTRFFPSVVTLIDWVARLVESDRGAVPAFRLVRFPVPLPEPDVRLPPHPALHEPRVGINLHLSSQSTHPTASRSVLLGSDTG
jgi:hypothetical protein